MRLPASAPLVLAGLLLVCAAQRADAVPLARAAAAPSAGAVEGLTLAQGACGRANFVCRQRFGGGRDYRRCMRRQGCGTGAGGRNRCQSRARFCARRFPQGSPRFGRCLRRGGC
ncbi:hypothetical protein [Acuticoccus sp.]|uniref:hypothetical protein n=1 Tax=Acuticoccus sp. TaxID=1904378 RepID=UPI003B515BD8